MHDRVAGAGASSRSPSGCNVFAKPGWVARDDRQLLSDVETHDRGFAPIAPTPGHPAARFSRGVESQKRRGIALYGLVMQAHQKMPSWSRASSVMRAGVHGGDMTSLISATSTPSSFSSAILLCMMI